MKKTVKLAIIAFNVIVVIIIAVLVVASFFNGIEAFESGKTAVPMLYTFVFVGSVSILGGRYMRFQKAF
ncbi:MAG: hypothetical protein VYA60_04625 [Pseudomonadota bacterium]|nr:hypothetical protein [Pseudomonadota bacterium]